MSKKEYPDLQLEGDEREEREFQESIWTGSASGKRKRDDRDGVPPEHHANKRPSSPSDFSGGVVMSAKPPNSYEGHIDPRLQNDNGSMTPPPPPRPQHKAINFEMHAGATILDQHRVNKEEGSSSRQKTDAATRSMLYEEFGTIINRELSSCPDLNLLLAPMLLPFSGGQNDQGVKAGCSVQTSAVATENPVHDYSEPIFTKPKLQHNQEACGSKKSDLGHHLHGYHTNGPTIRNEADVARELANKLPSPLMPDVQRGDQAHVGEPPDDRENPGVMNMISDDFRPQNHASRTRTLLADPSRKRSIGEVENEQSPSSLSKKRRAPPKPSCNNSLFFGSSMETPLAGSSNGGSVEGMEDALPACTPSESRQVSLNTDGNELPASGASPETPRAAASKKRSVEDMEDAPLGTSRNKRRRSSSDSTSTQSPPSSPFNPPEQSTPSLSLNLEKMPIENRTRGTMPDPAPLNQDAPPYDGPTTVTYRSKDTEGLALQSSSQSMDGRNLLPTNTDDQSAAHLEDPGATHNAGSETKEHGPNIPVSPEPESQGEHHRRVKDDPDGTAMDSVYSRDRTTTHLVQDGDNRTEQIAISVVIPLQIPQRRPAANQELSLDEDTANFPVVRNKRKRGRKPTAKGQKASQSVPQRPKERLQPRTRSQKTRQLKPENGQQAYVGRLRSGVGERKHKKPRLVILEFKGRKAVQVRAKSILK